MSPETLPGNEALARPVGGLALRLRPADLAGSALVLAAPWLLPPFGLSLLNEILIFALFAMSLDLLLGYTGLASLGQAAFFGVGAYLTGIAGVHLTPNLLVTLPIVLLGSGLTALVLGFLCLRVARISFLMLTLAFAQMIYAVAFKWNAVTGGSNGFAGVPRPTLALGPLSLSFGDGLSFYVLTASVALLGYFSLRLLVGSPWGHTLRGIKENEPRMVGLGYRTSAYKLSAFVVAGMVAGLAGMLYASFNYFVSPQDLYWTMSGQVLMMVVAGGAGTLLGPALGAALVLLLRTLVSSMTDRWALVMGAIFIALVLFAPHGLLGLLRAGLSRARRALRR
ncbi:MAG: branched-chain amino acid ABC transporter permease [Chloroflexales bacterium]|nr:branched-chain amino acid ABC transporter permease [Chloroflexales bacterium]